MQRPKYIEEIFDPFHGILTYHSTFVTYGTWLLGGPKGSMRHGGRRLGHTPALHRYMLQNLNEEPLTLGLETRRLITDAIVELSLPDKLNFKIWAMNVRTQHAHLLFTVHNGQNSFEFVGNLKREIAKKLRSLGLFTDRKEIWAENSYNQLVNTLGFFYRAANYDEFKQ